MYLGGEKLKNIKKSRLLRALCLFLLFSINIPCVFAQSEETEQARSLEQVTARITEAERAMPFGEAADPEPLPSGANSSVAVILRMLLVLVLAAAAIYGLVFFIKKASRHPEVQDPYLKVLAGTHLGSSRYAYVVSLGSKAWLVGASDGGVNLISEIDDKDILNAMLLDDSKKSAVRPLDFKAILGRLGVQAKSKAPGVENIRKRRDRIKGL